MTPRQLIRHLRQKGAALVLDGERLRIEAPPGLIDAPLREQLAKHKDAISEALEEQHQVVAAMSLDQLAQAGLVIRVHSDILGSDLLFVSDNVPDEAVERYQLPIYRAHELRKLAWLRPKPRALRSMHEVKKVFGGVIAAVDDVARETPNFEADGAHRQRPR